MQAAPVRPPIAPLHALFIALLLVSIVMVFAVAWLVVSALLDGHAGWMALFVAPLVVAPLRLGRLCSGASRCLLAVGAAATGIALGHWLVAALPVAQAMSMTPPDAALRMGPHFFWTLVALGNTPLDWLWVALALALAAWLGR